MTIEIIEEGLNNWNPKYIAYCRQCKCKFSCHREDGIFELSEDTVESGFVNINCPNCQYSCVAYLEPES